MKMNRKMLILIFTVIIFYSCGPEAPSKYDKYYEIPELSEYEILYNQNLKEIHLQTYVNDNSVGSMNYVNVDIYYPKSDTVSFKVTLNDSGKNGDQISNDQYFGFTYNPSLPDIPLGVLKAVFNAQDSDNNNAETVTDSIIFDLNYAPVIENIDAPDSIQRPTSGEEYIYIHATVSDANGLEDIRTVYFQVEDNDNPGTWSNSFPLYDDGNENYNDNVSGDGIFSGGFAIDSYNKLATNYLRYIAIDYSDEQSEVVKDSIAIY